MVAAKPWRLRPGGRVRGDHYLTVPAREPIRPQAISLALQNHPLKGLCSLGIRIEIASPEEPGVLIHGQAKFLRGVDADAIVRIRK